MVMCLLDNRGVGKSSCPAQKADYSTVAMAEDAALVLVMPPPPPHPPFFIPPPAVHLRCAPHGLMMAMPHCLRAVHVMPMACVTRT